jgi:hypothetical protein
METAEILIACPSTWLQLHRSESQFNLTVYSLQEWKFTGKFSTRNVLPDPQVNPSDVIMAGRFY